MLGILTNGPFLFAANCALSAILTLGYVCLQAVGAWTEGNFHHQGDWSYEIPLIGSDALEH